MPDSPDDAGPPVLTPMQRALAAKKVAQAAKGGPPKGRFQGDRAAAARSASKSKPWMKA